MLSQQSTHWILISFIHISLITLMDSAVTYKVSKRFGDTSNDDVWTQQESITLPGRNSLITCMSLCASGDKCMSYSYNDVDEQCVHYTTSFKVKSQPKSSLWKYYVFSDCPDDWQVVGENCYYLHARNRYMWYDAQKFCERYGAKLAELHTREEYESLLSMAYRSELHWIGGADLGKEGVWTWQKTGENITYDAWDWNQPNGGGRQNCLGCYLMRTARNNRNWHDKNCDAGKGFPLCERFFSQ